MILRSKFSIIGTIDSVSEYDKYIRISVKQFTNDASSMGLLLFNNTFNFDKIKASIIAGDILFLFEGRIVFPKNQDTTQVGQSNKSAPKNVQNYYRLDSCLKLKNTSDQQDSQMYKSTNESSLMDSFVGL